jgi:hypothetical protein
MTLPKMRIVGVAAALAALVAAVSFAGASVSSCAQTPPNLTTHTFRQAQKVDFLCMQVNDANGNSLPSPIPVAQAQCSPVPPNVTGSTLEFHLYAVVTQTTPGELGVVDLTAGNVIDIDKSTPGVNFIPVGADPTDVAVAPYDAPFTFVSSRDPNKMAIYAIDNRRLLGTSTGTSPPPPLTLTDLMACSLPQPPEALAIAPYVPADGGVAADGGGPTNSYALVVLLAGSPSGPATVLTLDPSVLTAATPGSLTPCASLSGAVLAARALSADFPSSWDAGPAWPDGVPYEASGPTPVPQCPSMAVPDSGEIEAEIDASDDAAPDAGAALVAPTDAGSSAQAVYELPPAPPHPTSIAMRNDLPLLYVADEAVPVIHVVDLSDPTNPIERAPLLATSLVEPGRQVAVGAIAISPPTRDYKTYLYAVDARQGSLMVYDITDPANSPHTPLQRPHPELNPLALPDRLTFSAPVATVAFAEHDWPLPSPLTSPTDSIHQYTGLLCNPNPNAHPDAGAFLDLGAYYRADQTSRIQPTDTQGGTIQTLPTRLRGVFGFVTLSNGNVVTIDVDDWDAPCRRPDPMAEGVVADPSDPTIKYDAGLTGVLDFPEPSPGPGDLDPYHAPIAYNSAISESPPVSLEAFFPVSVPHRLRSNQLLRNDPTNGVHVPYLIGVPQLFNASGAPVSTTGVAGEANPLLLPAPLPPGFIDPTWVQNPTEPNPSARTLISPLLESASAAGASIPSALFPSFTVANSPGVRVSFDDPTAHQDQDWTVTYEGAIPTVNGIAVTIASAKQPESAPGAYETLILSAPGIGFCERGIEDWSIGQTRVSQLLQALASAQLPAPPAFQFTGTPPPPVAPLSQWTADYVEFADDLLVSTDPYWSEPYSANSCWDGSLQNDNDPNIASNRYNACLNTFGTSATDDTFLARDFPIIHAYDDSLEVGRFAWYPSDPNSGTTVPEQTTNRVVVPGDPSNVPFLRLATCCFHRDATFKVRTGGEWVAVGSSVGLLHRVVRASDAAGSCVLSCDPRDALMNARTFDVPWATWSQSAGTCTAAATPSFDRNSPLAMRNPEFSYVVWAGCGKPLGYGDHTLTVRDLSWKYSMRGSFVPLTTSILNPNNGSAVSPQSMRFISPLGQLAVVDGESQGLVLIDLNLVAVTHNYY